MCFTRAAVKAVRQWAEENGIGFSEVPVGEDINDVYKNSMETLGITIGGDGTFLEGIKEFAPLNIPLLGINTGSLAFLVRVGVNDLADALSEVIRGRAEIDKRQQLSVVTDDLDVQGINDVMIKNVPPEEPVDRKIVKINVFADDEYVGEYDGTGLAVATPTGSTGISLGGRPHP